MTHQFDGATEGFKVTRVIYDADHDTQGFIGYLPSDSSIYVVYRGTASFSNWLTDLDSTKSDFPNPNCIQCTVHTGFWKAQQDVAVIVMYEVGRIFNTIGYHKVKVTGHSLGAALANLTAVELAAIKDYEVSLYNFG